MTHYGALFSLRRLLRWFPCWNSNWLLRWFGCCWFQSRRFQRSRGIGWCRCRWSGITATTCTTRRLGCQSSMGKRIAILGAVRTFRVPQAIVLDAVTVIPSTFVSTTRISYGWSVSRISPFRYLALEEVVSNTDT
jgi:hypothetical protein